jgi:hypothetical protein
MNEVVQGLCEAGAAPPPHASQPGAGGGGGREAQQAQQARQAAEASWRLTGDGAKLLHCLEDADVAGGCWLPCISCWAQLSLC